MRVRSRWNSDKDRSLEEIASALGFIIWRIAGNGVLNLENEGFQTSNNEQRLHVVAEFVALVVHLSDRLTLERLSAEERQLFITKTAMHCARHYQDNMVDAKGPGEYQKTWVVLLNQRMNEYAECDFSGEQPGFEMRRLFGTYVRDAMGPKDQKWIVDQTMDIEVPEIMGTLTKALKNLFSEDTDLPSPNAPRRKGANMGGQD